MNNISRAEQKRLLNRAPQFDDGFYSLRSAPRLPRTEGTNQLNRLNIFKSLVGRNIPEIEIFAHE